VKNRTVQYDIVKVLVNYSYWNFCLKELKYELQIILTSKMELE